MSQMPTFKSDSYTDGRTKQAFKDTTDINKLLAKAQKGEAISHLAKHGAMYGDFTDIDDLLTAQTRLKKGEEIFNKLPGEVRREFNQSPAEFFNFVNDPKNVDDLENLLPSLAQRGDQRVHPRRTPKTIEDDPQVKKETKSQEALPSDIPPPEQPAA